MAQRARQQDRFEDTTKFASCCHFYDRGKQKATWLLHTTMKLLICFILMLASLTAGTSAPRSGKPRASQSRIGTIRSVRQPRQASKSVGSSTRCATCEGQVDSANQTIVPYVAAIPGRSLRIVSGLAENTNSIFCEGPGPETANGCPVLRRQEPPPRRTRCEL